jgi:dipeptidyl aminopeptidase/acylaminoacyl peptidase
MRTSFATVALAVLPFAAAAAAGAQGTTNAAPEIYSVSADGTGRLDLSNDPAADESPAVSSDGGRIAFVSTRDGYEALYTMDSDGSHQQRICPQPSVQAGPCVLEDDGQAAIGDLAWSPDGHTLGLRVVFPGIALCFSPAEGDYVVDLAAGMPRQLAYGLLGPPRFSPDGRFVAIGEHNCKGPDVASIAQVETGAVTTYAGGPPVGWRPHGLRLLYERGTKDYQGGYKRLFLATIDQHGRHRWTLKGIPATAPAWSPSGRRVAFFRSTGSRRGLYVVHVGMHDARRLIRFSDGINLSAWSPNGRWIAFAGTSASYFVRSDGTGLRRVTGAPPLSISSPLIWSADSTHFAFVDGDGLVRVVTPSEPAAVAVTGPSDLGVCRFALGLPVCQIAWAGDRLVFASGAP